MYVTSYKTLHFLPFYLINTQAELRYWVVEIIKGGDYQR